MAKDDNCFSRWISIIYRHAKCYYSKRLESYGIGSGQYIFLLNLYRKDGISQEELSEYLRIDKATTAKAVKKLEDGGYVVRNVDISDKRAYNIYLTKKAMDIKGAIEETIRSWENILTSGFSDEEKLLIEPLLHKMAYNAYHSKADSLCADGQYFTAKEGSE